MKLMSLLLLIFTAVIAKGQDRESSLDALTKQFPAHIAGKINERTDPHIRTCYEKYFRMNEAITEETAAEQIVKMRAAVESDVRSFTWKLEDPKSVLDSPSRQALRQNISWLKQKVVPYLNRLAQQQRGR